MPACPEQEPASGIVGKTSEVRFKQRGGSLRLTGAQLRECFR
jgi:hypothetical protein